MKDYPFCLWLGLRFFRIIASLIPNKNLRRTMRTLPFALSRHAHQILHSNDLIKVDMFMSVGDACRPALHLREYGLRKLSNPLDWMMCYSLDEAHSALAWDLATFLRIAMIMVAVRAKSAMSSQRAIME